MADTEPANRDSTAAPGGGPLADVRVLDCSTVIAGPACARYLADFGADVIKVERPPEGDSSRRLGFPDPTDGTALAFKLLNRNKRSIALDLKADVGRETLLRLAETSHVLVENYRPGKLEALGLGPDTLLARNPSLVVVRVSGFGQTGPYAQRAGFATLAEAMGGWAAIAGEPDGAPMLPPVALTDEVTGLAAAFATMVALRSGVGQVVDVNLLETMLQVLGPLVPAYFRTGYLQPRLGSGIPYSVPRGVWQAADGRWVAISTSSETVAARVMALVGLGDDPRFAHLEGRQQGRDEVEAAVARFVASAPAAEVVAAFEQAEAAAAVVYDLADIAGDPHLAERGAFATADGITMQGLVARLSATPGEVRWAGRPVGVDTDAVLAELDRRSSGPA